MKIYTVHVKPGTLNAAENPVFIREGFNWLAFFFTFLWALYHRLWLIALLLLAYNMALMSLGKAHFFSAAGIGILQLAMQVFVGFHAGDWQRQALARRGYIIADIATGDSLLRAEQRYFERYLAAGH